MKNISNRIFNNPDAGSYYHRPAINVLDSSLTSLPTNSIADGVTLAKGDKVLFTNLSDSTKNNRVYQLNNQLIFELAKDGKNPNGDSTVGEVLYVKQGSSSNQLWTFDGTLWNILDVDTNSQDDLASISNITNAQSRRKYVDFINGNDVTGNGSLTSPYATVEKANISITDQSSSNTYFIYILNGNQTALTSAFTPKANVFIYGMSGFPIVLGRADGKEILNDGSNGTYIFKNINFSTGLNLSVTAASSLTMEDCTVGSIAPTLQVTCVADSASSLAGKYFLIDTPMVNYYHYYTVGGVGTDPAISGRKKLTTDLVANDSAATVASKTNTSLGLSLQIRQHSNDFSITTAGAPSGSFRITAICGVDRFTFTDGNTGFISSIQTQGKGFQVIGTSSTNKLSLTLHNCNITNMYSKWCTGTIRNGSLTNFMCDFVTSGGAGTYNLDNVRHTLIHAAGGGSVLLRGYVQNNSNLTGHRVIGRTSAFPFLNADFHTNTQIIRTICSITNGSSIVTIPSGQKPGNPFAVGNSIVGPGIPANTFVGDSIDLSTTQIRLVDATGAAVNATQTRSNITLCTRRVVFQDSALQSQFIDASDSNNMSYTPVDSSNWDAILPSMVTQALDIQASKKVIEENITLTPTDITNQYITLSNKYFGALSSVQKRPTATPTLLFDGKNGASFEYTVSTVNDANNVPKTRLTFVTNWATGGATALVSGDILHISGTTQIDNF